MLNCGHAMRWSKASLTYSGLRKRPEQAARALDSLEKSVGDLREEEVADALPGASQEKQASAIEAAGEDPSASKTARVIEETAVQSACME